MNIPKRTPYQEVGGHSYLKSPEATSSCHSRRSEFVALEQAHIPLVLENKRKRCIHIVYVRIHVREAADVRQVSDIAV